VSSGDGKPGSPSRSGPAAKPGTEHLHVNFAIQVVGANLHFATVEAEKRAATAKAELDKHPHDQGAAVRYGRAAKMVEFLRSEKGPLYQLEVLKTAGIVTVEARANREQSPLEYVMSISRNAIRTLQGLSKERLQQAQKQALATIRGRGR
jgi:hypothetical protein